MISRYLSEVPAREAAVPMKKFAYL
jgi:hypothetical protein